METLAAAQAAGEAARGATGDQPAAELAMLADPAPDLGSLGSIADARGRLLLPARGTLDNQFGVSDEFGVVGQGVHIATRDGAQVVAPFEGTVVFAGP